jgi:dTDP-glucose pyrophosphorylase
MSGWRETLIPASAKIVEAIRAIDTTPYRIALVVDAEGRLVGTVTDGDVRRGILRGFGPEHVVNTVMNGKPHVARPRSNRESLLRTLREILIRQLPVLDDAGRVIGLETIESLEHAAALRSVSAVIMAGGLGTRLRPLTDEVPKPMLTVGDRPLLQTIVENLIAQEIRRIYIAVNYKASVVTEHFGDGSQFGAEIRYLHESEKLGTAGALGLITDELDSPLLVMNGDLLTTLDLRSLLDYHGEHAAAATMCVREYDFQVPFGVVQLNRHKVASIDEKPVQRLFVNAGIYLLNPDLLRRFVPGEPIDMPSFLERMMADGLEVAAFPIREFWLDIGRIDDLRQANHALESPIR